MVCLSEGKTVSHEQETTQQKTKKRRMSYCVVLFCFLVLIAKYPLCLELSDVSSELGLVSSQATSTTGSNKTDLLTGRGVTGDGGGVTDVLVVTSSVGVIDGVHGHTTDLGPLVTLGLVFVEGVTGLEEGLIGTTTSSDETNHGTAVAVEDLLGSRGELHTRAVGLGVVADDGGVGSGGAGERSTVTALGLEVAHDGSLGHGADGENVSDRDLSLGTAVDVLASVETLAGDERRLGLLVLLGVAEHNAGEGGSSAGVVDDFADDTTDVALALRKVEGSVESSSLAVEGASLEDSSATLSLNCYCRRRWCDDDGDAMSQW